MKKVYHKLSVKSSYVLFTLLLASITHISFAQWTAKASMPSARDGSMSFAIGNKVYLGGGLNNNKDFWSYDPTSNIWTELADIPGTIQSRGEGVAFAINGKGYIGLGVDTTSTSVAQDVKRDLWQYDAGTNVWTQMASLPGGPRDGAFAFVINGIAYVGGGQDSAGNASLNDFWAYDPVADSWTAKANIPVSTDFPFAFSIGNYGYISCGTQDLGGYTESTHTWQYNPAIDTWTSKADFPGAARQAGAAFVLDSTAYCGLGTQAFSTLYQDFYTYDASTDIWSLSGNFPGGTDAFPVATSVNNMAFIGTGTNLTTAYSYWYEYTPHSTSITILTPDNDNVQAYPNPVAGVLHLNITSQKTNGIYTYSIDNMIGQCISSGTLSSSNIDVHNLPAGNYILKLMGDNITSTKMIIVK